ncbi:MAG: putative transcriptional regulator [Candidatus Eremiobacteraeota bacterium]|jgi:predicted transcriptional regulator|nr:putative transcriptional regulator [Candidatus Eremiobacteraeota bacterium]
MTSRTGAGFDFVLGPLESEIMEAAWSLGRWACVGDVLDERRRRGGAATTYSTVKNVMANLHEKGHLRKRPAGKQNEFVPAVSREQFARRAVGRVVDPLLRNHRHPLFAHIVDELLDDEQAIAEFEALIAERRKAKRT